MEPNERLENIMQELSGRLVEIINKRRKIYHKWLKASVDNNSDQQLMCATSMSELDLEIEFLVEVIIRS